MMMTDLPDDLSKDIYREAKLLRLIGCLFVLVATLSFAFIERYDNFSWNVLTTFLAVLFSVGIVIVLLGDRNIRKIKKHTGVDVPYI